MEVVSTHGHSKLSKSKISPLSTGANMLVHTFDRSSLILIFFKSSSFCGFYFHPLSELASLNEGFDQNPSEPLINVCGYREDFSLVQLE